MWSKLRKALLEVCDFMELLMAVAAIIGVCIAIIGLLPGILDFWGTRGDTTAFLEYIDKVFTIVIGIEFMKMLCKPNTQNIIEALIFLMARHMIVVTTTAAQDLLSVISICILFVFRRFMLATKPDKNMHVPNIMNAIRIAQNREFRDAVSKMEQEDKIEQEAKIEEKTEEKL